MQTGRASSAQVCDCLVVLTTDRMLQAVHTVPYTEWLVLPADPLLQTTRFLPHRIDTADNWFDEGMS